jgi:hypothetical protein
VGSDLSTGHDPELGEPRSSRIDGSGEFGVGEPLDNTGGVLEDKKRVIGSPSSPLIEEVAQCSVAYSIVHTESL